MHPRVRILLGALAAMLLASAVHAAPVGKYWTVTPFGGFTIFDGDMRFPGNQPLKDNVYFGGRIGYQAWRWMGIEGAAGFVPTEEDVASGGKTQDATYVFTNVDMFADAKRFKKAMGIT